MGRRPGSGHGGGRCGGLVRAFFSIQLRADQVVSGTAVNLLALGLTGYVFVAHYGEQGTPLLKSRASRT